MCRAVLRSFFRPTESLAASGYSTVTLLAKLRG